MGDINQIELQTIDSIPYAGDTPAQIKAKLGPATAINDGYLTHNDWIIFNNKSPALYTPENIASKTTDILLGGSNPSDTLYPSEMATKTYIDNVVIVTVSSALAEAEAFAAGAKMVLRADLI